MEKFLKQYIGRKCLIRTYSAGVWFGVVKELKGTCCILNDARRIYYWEGARSLSQIAVEGMHSPNKCQLPKPITDEEGVYLPQTTEVLPCTKQAIKCIEAIPVWVKN